MKGFSIQASVDCELACRYTYRYTVNVCYQLLPLHFFEEKVDTFLSSESKNCFHSVDPLFLTPPPSLVGEKATISNTDSYSSFYYY